jgi:flagellar basal-body rod modification protein FlgD
MMTTITGPALFNTTAVRTTGPQQVTGSKDTLDQSDFLRLLTAQLKFQDPLKPIENEAFVAQMAQFSSVAGISEMNEKLGIISATLDRMSQSSGQ